jgi:hypothetical protein
VNQCLLHYIYATCSLLASSLSTYQALTASTCGAALGAELHLTMRLRPLFAYVKIRKPQPDLAGETSFKLNTFLSSFRSHGLRDTDARTSFFAKEKGFQADRKLNSHTHPNSASCRSLPLTLRLLPTMVVPSQLVVYPGNDLASILANLSRSI